MLPNLSNFRYYVMYITVLSSEDSGFIRKPDPRNGLNTNFKKMAFKPCSTGVEPITQWARKFLNIFHEN